MTTYRCGCANRIDAASGVLRRLARCQYHEEHYRDPSTLDESYYQELADLDGTEIVNFKHVDEIVQALGNFPAPGCNDNAIEIGCGTSAYVPAICAVGWSYLGLDISPWAVDWVRKYWHVDAVIGDWEKRNLHLRYGLILCCHVLEHMRNAPAAIASMADSLCSGGELWIVVPDDTDPVNPDHLWFFTCDSLRACVESAGLEVVRLELRRIVKRENFIYCRARKR